MMNTATLIPCRPIVERELDIFLGKGPFFFPSIKNHHELSRSFQVPKGKENGSMFYSFSGAWLFRDKLSKKQGRDT